MSRTSRTLTSRVRRRAPRMLLAGVAVLIPVLTGCEAGLDSPTARFHPVAFGGYATSDGVTINNAFILGPDPGRVLPAGGQAGLFLSIFSAGGDRLVSASTQAPGSNTPGAASSVRIENGSVNVPAGGTANLYGPSPQLVLTGLTKPLSGGQTVTIYFMFATAGPVTVDVPVEPHAFDYATFQPPAPPPPSSTALPTTIATATATTTATHKKKKNPHPKAAASVTPSPTP